MIDIIIPTRYSIIKEPEKLHKNMFNFIKMAFGITNAPKEELLNILKTTPVVDICVEILKKCTNKDKAPYQILISKSTGGFIDAVNKRLLETKNDVVILNDDALVSFGWLEKLLAFGKGGIRGCKIIYPDGVIQHAGGSLSHDGGGIHIGRYHYDLGQFEVPAKVVYATFACAYIKRKLIKKVGLLDKDFGIGYFEDVDYCCRARTHGFSTYYLPIPIVHLERTSMDQVPAIKEHYEKNRQLFVTKWLENSERVKYVFANYC